LRDRGDRRRRTLLLRTTTTHACPIYDCPAAPHLYTSSTLGQTSTPSSDFKSILDAALIHALSEYKKKTGKELLDHPLATEVQRCDSVDGILAILQGQAREVQQSRDGDQRLMKWISPVVDVLYPFSVTLGGVAGLVLPYPVRDDLKCILTLLYRRSPLQE